MRKKILYKGGCSFTEEIIRYFNEECIKKFIDLRIDLYKSPEDLAGFITATRKETDKIARRFVETVIQEMNDVIKDIHCLR